MTTIVCILATLLAILTVPLLILFLLTESPDCKARRLYRSGLSQRQVAERMGCSRYRVRVWLSVDSLQSVTS